MKSECRLSLERVLLVTSNRGKSRLLGIVFVNRTEIEIEKLILSNHLRYASLLILGLVSLDLGRNMIEHP